MSSIAELECSKTVLAEKINCLNLRGIEFGPVSGASGVQGFFGEGYPVHMYFRWIFGKRFSFKGVGFVAKTMTLHPREGNMPRKKDGITPRRVKPKCIVFNLRKGVVLNAVGLSNLGAEALFENGRWMKRTDNFFISFMSVGKDKHERLDELDGFIHLAQKHIRYFRGKVGLQINYTCPNVGLAPNKLIDEAGEVFRRASVLNIPLVGKFNVLMSIEAARIISEHPACDAIAMSNTIPWGQLPDKIDWKSLFGSSKSPLEKFGGGGLSGKPLLPLVENWLERAKFEIGKPIVAGGGILGPHDAARLLYAGASNVALGSIAILRPWRLASTVREAYIQRGYLIPSL